MSDYLPHLSDLAEVGVAILAFVAFSVVGAAVAGRGRSKALDPLVGWAVLCLPFVLLGTLTTVSFLWIDSICLAAILTASVVCVQRKIGIGLGAWVPYVALALPFLLLVAPTEPYGWDQLSHWLPNTNYIVANQHFPREGLPPIASLHAGYPYGFALAIYWVEMAATTLRVSVHTVGVAATLNVLLFAIAARLLVEKIRALHDNIRSDGRVPLGRLLFAENVWLAAGLSLLLMTALSPTFLPGNAISASADNPTSVVLLALALTIAPSDERNARALLVQIACLLVIIVFLKEDNAVPAVALVAGRIARDARTNNAPWRTLREFALVSIPMLGVALLWHSYSYAHIPEGEMALRAPSEWRLDLLPQVLGGMTLIVVSKIGFFVCVAVTLFHAGRKLWQRAALATGDIPGAFAVVAAVGLIGYNLFLAFAYVSIFSPLEAERQSAQWRYETHLGLVLECAVVLIVCELAVRQKAIYGRLAVPVAALMLAVPIVFGPVIRPDLDPQSRAIRAVARDVDTRIAGASEITVVDRSGSGVPCPMFVYEAKTPLKLAGCVTKLTPCPVCIIDKAAREGQFIWTNGWTPILAQDTKLSLSGNASWLLERSGGKWSVAATWPMVPTRTRGVRAIWQAS
jgi:hypothetical protein